MNLPVINLLLVIVLALYFMYRERQQTKRDRQKMRSIKELDGKIEKVIEGDKKVMEWLNTMMDMKTKSEEKTEIIKNGKERIKESITNKKDALNGRPPGYKEGEIR